MQSKVRDIDRLRPVVLELLTCVPDDQAAFSARIARFARDNDAAGWAALELCARQHGVLGVIDGQLDAGAPLPEGVREDVDRRRSIAELWQAHLLDRLAAAARLLRAAGVGVCALKGPLFAARFYPPQATRHCIDLDLLIRERDLAPALDALAAGGYVATDTGASAAYLREHGHHVHLSRPESPPIELHFRAYAGFGVVLPPEILFDRAVPHELTGATLLVPSPEDEFLYLATHAAGHSFIRLMWLYDLKLLVRHCPTLDWDQIARRARAHGVEGAVGYASRLLHSWLGMELPALPDRFQRRGLRSKVADWLLTEVSTPQTVSVRDNLGGLIFTSLLCDRVSSGAALVQHHVLRSARRRLHRAAPGYVPDSWSG